MGRVVKASKAPVSASARQVLRVDLGEHKAPLEAFCEAQGMTVSQFVRSTLLSFLQGEGVVPDRAPAAPRSKKGAPEVHQQFLLTAEEDTLLQLRADAAGYPSKRAYLASLVRTHLTGQPQFGAHELRALVDSNGQLVSLMQLLRDRPAALPENLVDQVREHLKEVKAMIQRNVTRWTT